MNHIKWSLLSLLCFALAHATPVSAESFAAPTTTGLNSTTEVDFLPVDEAFKLNVIQLDENRLQVEWVNAESYYLYRHRFGFEANAGTSLEVAEFPRGYTKQDEFFGEVEVFYHNLLVTIPFKGDGVPFEFAVSYQGCADAGLCYPPQTRKFSVNPVSLTVEPVSRDSQAASQPTTTSASMGNVILSGSLASVIADESLLVTILLFFLAGIGLAFTPCVLPMVPILSSIIVGQKETPGRLKAFSLSVTYVLGMALTYAALGVLVGYFGAELNIQAKLQSPWVLTLFSLMFVGLAMSMFGFYELQLPERLRDRLSGISQEQQGGQYAGVALMGVLSSLVVSPCVSAPLAGALIYISATGNALIGGVALLALGLGMGAPLILIGSSGGHLLPKAGAWMTAVKSVFGVMLLAVAIWMLERIIPASVTLGLWAALLIISAIYLGALDTSPRRGWMQLWKGAGVISLVYGILLLIGAFSGADDPMRPLSRLNAPSLSASETAVSFRPVEDLESLQQILASSDVPAMFDFYADWCISCKIMEREVFSDPGIQQQLERFQLLQIDVTENSKAHQAVLKHFNLFGPPSILFFDQHGNQLAGFSIQGEMSREAFGHHLTRLLDSIQ